MLHNLKLQKMVKIVGAILFLVVLALGWKYPLLSYCMFLNAAGGIAAALLRGGRAACGNLCPRGVFYGLLPDTKRKIPRVCFSRPWSLLFMPLLMAGVILWLKPGASWAQWGYVFYAMLVATTVLGVIGELFFNRGFWCAVCPMGKVYRKIRPEKNVLTWNETCVKCGKCAGVCPFQFYPPMEGDGHVFKNADCIKCRRCVASCPRKSLSFPG